MADAEPDPYACIIDDCRYSSYQEELFSHVKFAREDETFSDDEKSPVAQDSGGSRRKLDGSYGSERRRGGEIATEDADSAGAKNLGFRGERKGSREGEVSGTKMEGFYSGEREIEPQSKKLKVSPLVHCSGKMVIEGEGDGEGVVVFRGDLKVEVASSSRSIVPETPGCTEKLDCEGDGDDADVESKMRTETGAKKRLEFGSETEVIDLEGKEEIEGKSGEKGEADKKEGKDHGEGSGKVEDDEQQGGTSTREEEEEDLMRRGKRGLPRSMFGLVWGEGSGDGNGNENRIVENGDVEGGLKEASVEGKEDGENEDRDGNGNRVVEDGDVESGLKEASVEGKEDGENGDRVGNGNTVVEDGDVEWGLKEASVEGKKDGENKGCEEEAIRWILDALQVLASEECSNEYSKIDVFETAKLCGLMFPRSRFLPEVEED